MAAGMSSDADPARLVDGLGTRWALAETSFKFHASCRHTHPAADALLQVMAQSGLKDGDIERVVTHVHQGPDDGRSAKASSSSAVEAVSLGVVDGIAATIDEVVATGEQQDRQGRGQTSPWPSPARRSRRPGSTRSRAHRHPRQPEHRLPPFTVGVLALIFELQNPSVLSASSGSS